MSENLAETREKTRFSPRIETAKLVSCSQMKDTSEFFSALIKMKFAI